MPELTLENLAQRVAELERFIRGDSLPNKDWRLAAGMFTGREISKLIDEEGLKIREADREAAREEFGE